MQRQNLPPFISHAAIFVAMAPHLSPQSVAALAQSCQLASNRVKMFLNDPVLVLDMLGGFSREEAAQFFLVYGNTLWLRVQELLDDHPEHFAAYALLLMMTDVKQNNIFNDMEKMAATLEYLEKNHFPPAIIDSIQFVSSMLTLPRKPVRELLHNHTQFYINLKGANLDRENLDDCNLTGACFQAADISEASVKRAMLAYANLQHARLTYSSFEDSNFRNAVFDDVQEDLGFPNEPVFKNTRYFLANEPLSKKLLDHYRGKIPDFVTNAIAEDFIKHSSDDVNHDRQVEILEDAQGHALISDHGDAIFNFISNNLFTVFTSRQQRIADAIQERKRADDAEAAPAVLR